MIAEVSHALQNLGVESERTCRESLFNHRSDADDNSGVELENHDIATDVKYPIDRLERVFATYESTWQGTA